MPRLENVLGNSSLDLMDMLSDFYRTLGSGDPAYPVLRCDFLRLVENGLLVEQGQEGQGRH